MNMPMPAARGAVSAALLRDLVADDGVQASTMAAARRLADGCVDAVADEDLQICLTICYELHYRGVAGVSDTWEWDPDLLRLRSLLERRLEAALRTRVVVADDDGVTIDVALSALVAADDGPPLSSYLAREATLGQWREFVALRSVYHLKEADPHTWVLPRIGGRAKAAMVEIQADEYGGGDVRRMHCELFARVMRALDLDDSYGAYVDAAPAVVLAGTNALSMMGLHRRLRGAAVGHLAAFEMTSTEPNRRYGAGVRRLRLGQDATLFYDEHVEADAVHEQVASVDMCGSFVRDNPGLRADVLFGAGVALTLDACAAGHQLASWSRGASALVAARSRAA